MAEPISQKLNALPGQSITGQTTITVKNPPQPLLQLPPGSLVTTQVISSSKDGIKKLDSIFGQLTIRTALTLPQNSKLELQLSSLKPQVQFLLKKIGEVDIKYPINAKSINRAIEINSQKRLKLRDNRKNRPQSASNALKLDIGAKIHATLLTPVKNNPNNIVKSPTQPNKKRVKHSIKENSQLSIITKQEPKKSKHVKITGGDSITAQNIFKTWHKLKTLSEKASGIASKTANFASNQFLRTINFFSENNKKNNSRHDTPLAPGTKLILNFIGAKDSNLENLTNLKTQHKIIHGVVVATTPMGQPIINTPLGMMAIEAGVKLEIGLNILLGLVQDQITLPSNNSPVIRFESIFQSKAWPSLLEAINEIEIMAPRVSDHLIRTKLPQSDTKLTSNTLFFLNALKSGDIQSWIGRNATNILAQNKPQLLNRLREEFSLISQANSDQQSNEWRTAIIPFLTTTGLEKFHLHTQVRKNKDNGKNKDNSSRFIIDISLSRLGRLQLDGFLRKKKRKKLDLIVRAQKSLPKQMRLEISKIYSDFSKISRISGDISFQVNQRFVEIPMPQLTDYTAKGVVI